MRTHASRYQLGDRAIVYVSDDLLKISIGSVLGLAREDARGVARVIEPMTLL